MLVVSMSKGDVYMLVSMSREMLKTCLRIP